jgi:hypothetical protein
MAALLAALWLPLLALAHGPDATLPSQCLDQRIAPETVVLACGDAGFIAQELVWSDWGAAQAHATGTAVVKTCDPDCATGGREEHPVALVADDLRDCAHGEPQYTRVTYSFPEASPFPPGSPGAEDPTVAFPCPVLPHEDPRITSMRLRLTGHNAGSERYFVRVRVRLRVCAVRGRAEVVFNETKRAGGERFGEHTRIKRFRQSAGCQSHSFRWRLRDEFFGVGTYRVAATAWDKDSQFSRTVSRRQITLD